LVLRRRGGALSPLKELRGREKENFPIEATEEKDNARRGLRKQ